MNFEASGEVLATPTITAPAAGSTAAGTDTVSLTWSTPTDPDRFMVCLNCGDNSIFDANYLVPGSAREFKIAPGALVNFERGAVVTVAAYKFNFLTSASSPADTSNVQFVARSPEAHIRIIW
ncbi:MAG: hypothetical protein H0T54_01905 [Geodermatophilaceae bacterium]|nr:hypothetical protein [Geodermatophilaceae bacterium]